MSKSEEEFKLLENMTARVIYYSCMGEYKTISEIAELWEYRTTAYFYQKKIRKLIKSMENKSLISPVKSRGAGISTNYDLILNTEGVNSFFKRLNTLISNELILWIHDYEIGYEELEKQKFREWLIDQSGGLRDLIKKVIFNEKDVQHFILLWKDDLFKHIFLSSKFIKALFKERRDLPQNPREFLYELTFSICDDINIKEEDFFMLNPLEYIVIDDEGYEVLLAEIEELNSFPLDSSQKSKLNRITTKLEDIVEIFIQKAREYPEEMEEEDVKPHLKKFIKKMGFPTTK